MCLRFPDYSPIHLFFKPYQYEFAAPKLEKACPTLQRKQINWMQSMRRKCRGTLTVWNSWAPVKFFLVIGVQVTVNNSSAKHRRQYNVISSSCISVFLSKRWRSTSQPKTAFQCYGRLSTRIIPGLKPGEIEGREKITEASPQHGGVRSKG